MKRALVTGGTKGIGAAIVRALARDGARVATTARSPLPAGETPELFVQSDVSTASGVAAASRLASISHGLSLLYVPGSG
jgi:NAD(P)-dependent dehydrogenase (short-subunit alcohol dehydrogenase family)